LGELAGHIVNSDPSSAIRVLEKIYNDGNEPIQILTNLMSYFKNLLIAKTCDVQTSVELTGLSEAQISTFEDMKKSLEIHQIVFLINKTADYIKDLKETTNQQMWLEVALIDLANLSDNTKLVDLQNRLSALESGVQPAARRVSAAIHQNVLTPARESVKQPVSQTFDRPSTEQKAALVSVNSQPAPATAEEEPKTNAVPIQSTADIKSLWIQILREIPSQADQALLSLANPVQISADKIVITIKNAKFVEKANSPEKKQCIIDAAAKVLGKNNIPVLVREPLPDDKKIDKVKVTAIKKTVEAPRNLVEEHDEVSEPEKETAKESENEPESKTEKDFSRSDQSNMVRELFDGKFLD